MHGPADRPNERLARKKAGDVRDLARLGHRKRRYDLEHRQPDRLQRDERRRPVDEDGSSPDTATAERAIGRASPALFFAGTPLCTPVRRDGGKEPGRQGDRQTQEEHGEAAAHAQNVAPVRAEQQRERREDPSGG